MTTTKKLLLLFSICFLISISAVGLIRFFDHSKIIATGCFHQVAHKGTGCAALIQKDGQIVLQLNDFQTTENNDLHILLISAPDALENETVKMSERLYVAKLEKSEGSQVYVVPNGQNLTKFNSVVIWNSKYGVNFTTAPLRFGN
jgi:hypothetical protein